MPEIVLPNSPNWFLSSVSSGNDSGLYAFGARNNVFVYDVQRTSDSDHELNGDNGNDCTAVTAGTVVPSFVACYTEHSEKITAVTLSPDSSQWLCCSCDEISIRLWDIRSLVTIQSQNECKEKLTCMTWCPRNTDLIVTACEKGTVLTWKLSKNAVQSFRFEKEYVYSIKASPHHASQVALGYRMGTVLIVDLSANEPIVLQKLRGQEGEITSISWCPLRGENVLRGSGDDDDGVLIAAASRKIVKIWSSTNGKEIWFKKLPQAATSRQDPQDLMGKRQWLDILWHKSMPQYILCTSSGSFGELFLLNVCQKNDQEMEHFTVRPTGKNRFIFNIAAVGGDKLCTFSLDRMISVWSLKQRELLCSISSFGGHVYCIRGSPVDPGFVAIAAGDSAVRIWNQGNKSNPLDFSSLYFANRVKITALACHPKKEGLLAFGTDQGRVGVCNTLNFKAPTVSATSHNKTVYVVCWAPPLKMEAATDSSYQVYSVGDGTILQHFIGESKKPAINFLNSIMALNKTETERLSSSELSWRKDNTGFAVGYDTGCVAVYNFPSLQQLCKITTHSKIINCIRWHPETTGESPGGSQCKNWVAFAGNGTTISVVDLSKYFDNLRKQDSVVEEITQVFCQVEGHLQRTTDLCWSPHHDGRLASVGYDNTAIVWNMKSSEAIASFKGHSVKLLTVHWSNLDPDVIMTGGFDATLRVWRVSEQTLSILCMAERKRRKKNLAKIAKNSKCVDVSPEKSLATQEEITELQELIMLKKRQLLQHVPNGNSENGQESVGSSPMNFSLVNHQPVHNSKDFQGHLNGDCQSLCTKQSGNVDGVRPDIHSDTAEGGQPVRREVPLVSDLVSPVKPLFPRSARVDSQSAGPVAGDGLTSELSDKSKRRKNKAKSLFPVCAAANNRSKAALHEDILDLTRLITGQGPSALVDTKPHLGIFTDRLGAHRCILQESEYHLNNENMEYHLQLELWRGNIAGAVQIARQRNELSDWIVAMAPLASHDLWELVSAEYAEQLEEDGQYHKAATYLLAAHKVYQAIDLFRRHRLFREAVSLARIRLSPVDPLLEDLYTEWGQNLMKDGLFEQAAKCYLAMRHIQEAGKALTRRYDQTSLKTACHMTLLVNDKQQGLSYAYKLFTQNLLMGEWQEAYTFLAEHNSLKVLLPLLSTHELLIHHLSIMCPSMVLTQKPVTKASFSQWCKTDDMKSTISLPEFLVDRSDVDPVVPWEPYLIGGHTFPHHLLRVWHQHLDITMVTQELMAMHTAISQLISLRQNLGDLPNLLILVSMDITLCLLVLLTSETSSAIVHLLQAMSTLHSSGNRLLLQALCRLILPQGPKYMLKLQQEFNASRVLITMESHGDVDKAGGEGHNSIKKFVTDIKEDSAITMSSPRCRELDCLRAFYYLAVLDYLHNSCSSTQQEEDILDGMPNRQNLSRDNIKVDLKETKNSGSDMVDVVSKGCDITMNVNPTHNSLTASSVYQTIVTDFSNIGKTCSNSDYCAKNSVNFSHCTVSPSSASSSLPTLLLPGSRLPTDSSSPVDPPSVPSSVHQTQSTVHPSTTSHQSILVGTATSKPATASEEPSLPGANGSSPVMTGKGHDYKGQLNHKNLLRLSKGILWDVQAKREALTETLGHIHSAIAQHLLANRSEEMSKSTSALSPTNCSRPFMSPLDGELEADGCCHQSRHFTLPSQSLSPTAFSVINSAAVKTESILCSANTPQTVLDAVATSFTKVDDQVSSSGDNVSLDRARSLSPQPTVKSSDKVNRGPFRSKSENSASNLSVQLDTTVSPQVETELLNSFEGTSVAFQKTKKILWLDNSRRSMDESLGSPQPTISKLTPDGNVIPVEWVDLPVDVRYIQPYLTLPLLKHEQDIVTQELKRLPDASKVPFPCTSTSVRRLLEACLSSPHLSKEQKVSYFKQLNDWAMLFAVTTHQQHETNTMFSDAFADYFKH